MAILFGKASFSLVRGTEWNDDIQLTEAATGLPVDLTDVTEITLRVRRTISSPILIELSLAAGTLLVTEAVEGKIGIRVSSADTRGLPENNHRKGVYVYDAILTRAGGQYEAAIAGKIKVLPQITRPWGTT